MGTYTILIGTFFPSMSPIVVLMKRAKLYIMGTKIAETSSWSGNIHNDLIESCRRGEQKAQFQIYKLYYKAMYNTSLRIVNNPLEAEDIMQESFLVAFEQIGTYSGDVSFGAWLKKIVQNRSIDSWRKSRKMIFEDLESACEKEDNSHEYCYSDEQPDGRVKVILDAIKRLSEGCRNIFTLYFLEGYDYEEISKILSISASTTRSQLSRAKNRLISELRRK
jgi:RNA polymerase sigma-70 factor (ECF subfamily)